MNTEAEQQITSLQCAHCQVTIETLNDKVMHLMKQAEQAQPVARVNEQGNVRMTLDAGEIRSSVGYVYSVHGERIKNACIRSDIPNGTPLYTAPPPRQPLTDEQIKAVLVSVDPETKRLPSGFRDFARAIEAAHGIKGEA